MYLFLLLNDMEQKSFISSYHFIHIWFSLVSFLHEARKAYLSIHLYFAFTVETDSTRTVPCSCSNGGFSPLVKTYLNPEAAITHSRSHTSTAAACLFSCVIILPV